MITRSRAKLDKKQSESVRKSPAKNNTVKSVSKKFHSQKKKQLTPQTKQNQIKLDVPGIKLPVYNNTVQSKEQNKIENVEISLCSPKPTRELRRRVVPKRYKDYSLDSSLIGKQKPAKPNPLAVFDFEYDLSEESQRKRSESESSYEENNSMKNELRRLRKRHKKVTLKNQKKANLKKNKRTDINEKKEQSNKKKKTIIAETKSNPVTLKQNNAEKKTANVEDEIILIEKSNEEKNLTVKKNTKELNTDNNTTILSEKDCVEFLNPIEPVNKSIDVVQEVTRSFIEDLTDETSNDTSGKIKILSNVFIRGAKPKEKENIFNSTAYKLKSPQPWRLDVSTIQKNSHYFTYKDKSFTPRYDAEKLKYPNSCAPKEKKNVDENSENIRPPIQTSILDFVKGNEPRPIENKSVGLFGDLPQRKSTKRKVLGEINYVQSTPIRPNFIANSPSISFISPEKNSFDSMFGFSYISDDNDKENNKPSSKKIQFKEILPDKPKTITPQEETIETTTEKENLNEIPTSKINNDLSVLLFQDVEDELHVSKKSTRKYVRKQPKRKRYPFVDTVDDASDDEPEDVIPEKKKQKNAFTKKEEAEINKLVTHYNSIFEEIDNYALCIE